MQLDTTDLPRLMAVLGENSRTAIPFHFLKRRRARAWADDDLANAIIETATPEPMAFIFGDDADWQGEVIASLGWMRLYWCPDGTVEQLTQVVRETHDREVVLEPDIQRTVSEHVHIPAPAGVEIVRMTAAYLPAIAAAATELSWLCNAWDSWQELLERGIILAALADGRMVSAAVTFARADTMDDIGVVTDPTCQCRGLSSACASALVREILAEGRRPLWTVFLSNIPSVRISEKLGFVTRSRCTVVRAKTEDDNSCC